MKYSDKSFSVGQSGRSPDVCAQNGHAEPDRRGRCFMCGEVHVQQGGQTVAKIVNVATGEEAE